MPTNADSCRHAMQVLERMNGRRPEQTAIQPVYSAHSIYAEQIKAPGALQEGANWDDEDDDDMFGGPF